MQIHRLFEIVYVLLERPSVTARELAGRFEVSQRTIYRDVELLAQAGIPIYMSKGRGGGISLLEDFVLNKAVLTEHEKNDILASLQAVGALSGTEDDSAVRKLRSLFGSKNADWIEVDWSSWGYYGDEAAIFETVKTAILEKRVLSFSYSSGRAETLRREVWPLKLLFKGAAWYLFAHCTLRNDTRFFKLRRMTELALLPEHFEMEAPTRVVAEPVAYSSMNVNAEYQIDECMAFRVYDEFSDFIPLENGDFLCRVTLPDLETVCMYASSFGEHARIVSPPEAIEAMRERLLKSMELYG